MGNAYSHPFVLFSILTEHIATSGLDVGLFIYLNKKCKVLLTLIDSRGALEYQVIFPISDYVNQNDQFPASENYLSCEA